jgi:spore coat-associated protein N
MMDDLLHEMINPAPAPRDAARRRRLWTTVIIVGLAAIGATTLTTSAIFTDEDATSASIQTGNVSLTLSGTTPFQFTPQDLAPGSSTFVPVTVTNDGSLELRYSISYFASPGTGGTGTGNLSDVLELRMYAVDAASCTLAGTNGVTTINTSGGAVSNWPLSPGAPLVGNPGVGPNTGDRTLPSGIGNTESLCARVDFPLSAGNEYQDTSVTLNLVFNSEQTLNN